MPRGCEQAAGSQSKCSLENRRKLHRSTDSRQNSRRPQGSRDLSLDVRAVSLWAWPHLSVRLLPPGTRQRKASHEGAEGQQGNVTAAHVDDDLMHNAFPSHFMSHSRRWVGAPASAISRTLRQHMPNMQDPIHVGSPDAVDKLVVVRQRTHKRTCWTNKL